MRSSGFVAREGIQSAIVYPLYIEDEPMGLLFASYRYPKTPATDELETMNLFADIAALVLREARLRDQLGKMRGRLERRLFLDWVSMIEVTWRHSLVQRAAAIRNHVMALEKRLERSVDRPWLMEGVPETIAQIDKLAAEIAATPPRVPQSWELEAETLPLAPLLEEVAHRERESALQRPGAKMEIKCELGLADGLHVHGYRRWLTYALEALLNNARIAMPQGGSVLINAVCKGEWAEIRVCDTGRGVPEAIRDKLFEELVPKEQDQSGISIGALLAAIIIEEHGGTIELERPGPGETTVLIRLPIAETALV